MEKQRLSSEAEKPGVRGLTARHSLAQLMSSSIAEALNMALIKAEAAVRMITRRVSRASQEEADSAPKKPTEGTKYWMNMDILKKKKLYGRRASSYR